jgi:agmatinase
MQQIGPQDSLKVPRFCGVSTYMRLPYTRELAGVDVAVVGLPFDTGSPYRVGCRFGPNAIRQASVLLRPVNPYHDINVFEQLSVVDYGDSIVQPGETDPSFERMDECLAEIVAAGVVPLGFGGDNAVTYPELKALGERHGPISVLHFDAHTDTWGNYFGQRHNAGTAYRRAVEDGYVDATRSIQVGMRGSLFSTADLTQSLDLGYEIVSTDEMFAMGMEALAKRIRRKLAGRKVFLSLDLDIVDPAFAPGVQIPECGGVSAREMLSLLRQLGGLDIVGADVVECNPLYDHAEITALLGATIGAEILALIAVHRRDNGRARNARQVGKAKGRGSVAPRGRPGSARR